MKVCSFPPHCLIVLDNVPYHGIQSNKPLTFILKIFKLKTGFIEIIQIMRKWQNFNNSNLSGFNNHHHHVTDSIFGALNHKTVWWSPHHCGLNVTEFICNIIKILHFKVNWKYKLEECYCTFKKAAALLTTG